jgi:hypothetical protein
MRCFSERASLANGMAFRINLAEQSPSGSGMAGRMACALSILYLSAIECERRG